MARPRTIDQNEILNAAEAVVRKDGAARLTLDAVAVEAGVSKGSVIYDYKTKHALMKAVIDRCIIEEREKYDAALDKIGDVPNAYLHACLAVAATGVTEDMQAISMQMCSALAQDIDLRKSAQQFEHYRIETVLKTSENPRRGLVALLAISGLQSLEFLGLHSWPEDQRTAILRDIETLIGEPEIPGGPVSHATTF